MTDKLELPQWRCHKIVRAAKITNLNIDATAFGFVAMAFGEEPIPNLTAVVPPAWHAKHKPEVGGYYVQYEDGYTSYSPAAAFESGYSRIPS